MLYVFQTTEQSIELTLESDREAMEKAQQLDALTVAKFTGMEWFEWNYFKKRWIEISVTDKILLDAEVLSLVDDIR